MTEPIQQHETLIVGEWETQAGHVVANATASRIDHLVTHCLVQVAVREAGWTKLFKDPGDGRFWELSYPQGQMHGGGPPKLEALPRSSVTRLYGDVVAL